ncbi:TRAFAC clade GTPase domain-containing protein [Bradyrhizobium sp. AZCC 1693]|uniref:TRAFAC clade GTPase domain-containing protein n=1 Tax=Bradyrhizobium sp. AZCC 1693 TaxID=3117029 RepID=UPI002FF04F8F
MAMIEPNVSIVGLPGSGKTTFLAALWHLVQSGEIPTRLRYGSMSNEDYAYLNQIVKLWRRATEQGRTQIAGMKSIAMHLVDAEGRAIRVSFPDVPGENYRAMWEDRKVDEGLAENLGTGNIMLLVNGDRIKAPAWITERLHLAGKVEKGPAEEPARWEPRHAPTQVQLVDLLQHLMRAPLHRGARLLAVMIGAWDQVEGEGLSPVDFQAAKLPFLDQYLKSGRDEWTFRTYGLSAQGGEFDENDENNASAKVRTDANRLRELDVLSTRIRLVSDGPESHDLTEPLEWLMGDQ